MTDLLTREPVSVLEHTVADDLDEIGRAWPWFENLVGLKGRKMYARIGPAMEELKAAGPHDETRPLIEFYRRRDEVELWVPIS